MGVAGFLLLLLLTADLLTADLVLLLILLPDRDLESLDLLDLDLDLDPDLEVLDLEWLAELRISSSSSLILEFMLWIISYISLVLMFMSSIRFLVFFFSSSSLVTDSPFSFITISFSSYSLSSLAFVLSCLFKSPWLTNPLTCFSIFWNRSCIVNFSLSISFSSSSFF